MTTAGGRWRIDLAYDGSGFSGWQIQPDRRTVQGELVRMLRRLGEGATPMGAGRTDAGVHALRNTAHVDLSREWGAEDLRSALQSLASGDLAVLDVRPVEGDFHARYRAVARLYAYALGAREDLFLRGRRWRAPDLPGVAWMREALPALAGERDFSSFAKAGGEEVSPICTVTHAGWEVFADGAVFTVRSNRFLYGMVRAMVGTLIGNWRRGESPASVAEVLAARDRGAAGAGAPPEGLYLVNVAYPGEADTTIDTGEVARLAGLGGGPAPAPLDRAEAVHRPPGKENRR